MRNGTARTATGNNRCERKEVGNLVISDAADLVTEARQRIAGHRPDHQGNNPGTVEIMRRVAYPRANTDASASGKRLCLVLRG